MKRRVVRTIQKYALNPVMRLVHGYLPGTALLETTGRRTGRPRRVPVGGRLDGDTFWLVAEHGHHADYVRNLVADPRVRLRVARRWREGTAHPMPEDDARERAKRVNRFNAIGVIGFGTDLLTIRIDLEPLPPTS